MSNKRLPIEVGYFLPPEPTRRYGPISEDRLVLQTEDVVVDRRGFIYISDKNQGLCCATRDRGPAYGGRDVAAGQTQRRPLIDPIYARWQ